MVNCSPFAFLILVKYKVPEPVDAFIVPKLKGYDETRRTFVAFNTETQVYISLQKADLYTMSRPFHITVNVMSRTTHPALDIGITI